MLTEFEARELRRFNEFLVDEGRQPLQTHKEVCPGCKGEGRRLTRSIREHAYTQDEIAEMGDEWFEFVDDMRAGVYDETCETCNGLRVVDSVNLDSGSDLMLEFLDWLVEASESQAIYEMERRMGA